LITCQARGLLYERRCTDQIWDLLIWDTLLHFVTRNTIDSTDKLIDKPSIS